MAPWSQVERVKYVQAVRNVSSVHSYQPDGIETTGQPEGCESPSHLLPSFVRHSRDDCTSSSDPIRARGFPYIESINSSSLFLRRARDFSSFPPLSLSVSFSPLSRLSFSSTRFLPSNVYSSVTLFRSASSDRARPLGATISSTKMLSKSVRSLRDRMTMFRLTGAICHSRDRSYLLSPRTRAHPSVLRVCGSFARDWPDYPYRGLNFKLPAV